MAYQRSSGEGHLPIIPTEVLKKHNVFEKFDTRFRSCARLLQALWRDDQGLPIGSFTDRSGRKRRIGSLLGTTAADDGRNFMSPAIAYLAWHEIAYQEPGALIDRQRLYSNLLSSMPLAFNLFGLFRLDLKFAAKVMRSLLPEIGLKSVRAVMFEHSPGRRDETLTGDRSAFDVAIIYDKAGGKTGAICIEVKYSETLTEPAPTELNPRYDVIAASSNLHKEPMNAVLRVNPFQQLFREHLLAQAALDRADWDEAHFVVIAPRGNYLVQENAKRYAAFLNPPGSGQVPFHRLDLEQCIEALGWAGAHEEAVALHQRYCDWARIDDVVAEALRAKGRDWMILPARSSAQPVALIGKAA